MALELGSIRQRVKTTGLFLSVSDVTAMADALDTGFVAPAAFVVLPSERADGPDRVMGTHRQKVNARVSIAFVIKAQRADQERSDEIEGIRTVLRSHIAGWTATGAERPFDYATSIVRSVSNGFVWVEMLFDTSYRFSAD